jgi:hypothetical protein
MAPHRQIQASDIKSRTERFVPAAPEKQEGFHPGAAGGNRFWNLAALHGRGPFPAALVNGGLSPNRFRIGRWPEMPISQSNPGENAPAIGAERLAAKMSRF